MATKKEQQQETIVNPVAVQDTPVVLKQSIEVKKRTNKVAIVGFAESSFFMAPYDNPDEWEIWGLNELYMRIPRWDRWFQLHNRAVFVDDFSDRDHDHIAGLNKLNCPVYMCEAYEDVPLSVKYPLADVVRYFTLCPSLEKCNAENAPSCLNCKNLDHYFTNSISYMIALAIMEGFEEIAIYGVDMAQDTEYASQKPSCEFFIGWAKGAGIKVTIPKQSDLLKAYYFYGFEKEPGIRTKYRIKAEELKKRMNDHNTNMVNIDGQIAQLQKQKEMQQRYIDHLQGGAQLCDYFLKNF